MKSITWKILSAVPLACAIIGIIASLVSGGCAAMLECTSGMVPMKCHWTFTAVPFVLGIGAVTSVGALLAKTTEGRRMAALGTLAASAAAALIVSPAGIGICAKAGMECHTAAHVIWVVCAISIVAAIAQMAKANPEAANAPKMKL